MMTTDHAWWKNDLMPGADELERSYAFTSDARELGLISLTEVEGFDWKFSLNHCTFFTKPQAQVVFQVAQLARKYASGDCYGAHNEILGCSARRDAKGPVKLWMQAFCRSDDEYESLRDWLKENGINMYAVYSPKHRPFIEPANFFSAQ